MSLPTKSPKASLLLRSKPRRPNIRPPQLNPQHSLHRRQNLLIRSRATALEIRNDRGGSVALCRQVLLRHLRLHLLALVGDHGADFLADCVGLDDLVAAVDFGEALAFAAAGLGDGLALIHTSLQTGSNCGQLEGEVGGEAG